MMLYDGITLYHGSYVAVETPDLSKCREGKDFGKGFYLTTDKQQARRFVKTTIQKAVNDHVEGVDAKQGFLSVFRYRQNTEVKIHSFLEADQSWLRCVAGHRRADLLPDEQKKWRQYDLICGKIANDRTNLVITTFLQGGYGDVTSKTAMDFAISLLMPERLKNQVCCRNERSLQNLEFVKTERVII
ncbi:MAG: DUF3990 domain-containing protein [Lachnospiraceae bacterium]|nr:DUF3990 domain-containing protein [Lachnospiraceae bacterium]